jgi:predicted dehydrogenase
MTKRIGVGVVGVRTDRGWGGVAHVPAIQAVPTLELRAIANSTQASADAAAQAVGVAHSFGDPRTMVRHPDVDMAAVAVKAPAHRNIVNAAISAGRAIYCEWPLGANLRETEELSRAASRAGVSTAIGLQGRPRLG